MQFRIRTRVKFFQSNGSEEFSGRLCKQTINDKLFSIPKKLLKNDLFCSGGSFAFPSADKNV